MKMLTTPIKARQVLNAAQSALAKLNDSLSNLEKCVELVKKRQGEIIITGIGKSGFIGQKIAATLTSLGQRASYLHPVEAIHGDIGALSEGDVLLALSFSGESKEVVKIVSYAKKNFGVSVIAFTKSKHSSLGKIADVVVEIKIKSEGSPNEMAPMASTTATLVLGDIFAAMLTEKDFTDKSFARLHPGGSLGLRMNKVKDFMRTSKSLPLVSESDSFTKILKSMSIMKLGATGVVNSRGSLVGVITDGDLRRLLLRNQATKDIQAEDIMTRNPKYAEESDSLESALSQMEKFEITHLFAVNKKMKPVGVIHIHDILEKTFFQQ